MVRNKLSILLRFVISFGLLLVLVWIMRKDAGDVLIILKGADKALILLAICVNLLLYIALAYRLKLLMYGQKVIVSIKDAIYLTFVGYFYNNFLPTAIGGDIAKAYYASRSTNNKVASYAAVLADRIIGLVATLLIALIGLLFIGKSLDNELIIWVVPVIFLFTAAAIALLLKKNNRIEIMLSGKKGLFHTVKEKLLKLYTAINLYRNSPVLLVKGIVLSLALQTGAIISSYFLILSTSAAGSIPLFRLFLIIPLVWTVSMLPSLNGLGVREGAFVYFLKGYIGPEKAFAVSLLWLGLIMLYSVIGGIFQLVYHPIKIGGKDSRD